MVFIPRYRFLHRTLVSHYLPLAITTLLGSPDHPRLLIDTHDVACTELVHWHYLGPRGEQVPVLVTLLLPPPPDVEAPTHKVVGFRYGSDMPGARSA